MERWKFIFVSYNTTSKNTSYAKNSLIVSSRDTYFGYWDSEQFSSRLRTTSILVVWCVTIFEKLFLKYTPYNNSDACVYVIPIMSWSTDDFFWLYAFSVDRKPVSIISIVTTVQAEHLRSRLSIPVRGQRFFFQSAQTGCGTHITSYPMCLFPLGVKQLESTVTQLSPSNADVKSEWNCTSTPLCAFLACTLTTLPLQYYCNQISIGNSRLTQPHAKWVSGLFRRAKSAGVWSWPRTPNWCRGYALVELYLYSPFCASLGMLWGDHYLSPFYV
jgi:hypothetical protein